MQRTDRRARQRDSEGRGSERTGKNFRSGPRPSFSPDEGTVVAVSSVEPQKRDPERVNVFVGGEFAFSLNALLSLELDLRKGAEIPAETLANVLRRDEVGKAVEACVRLLGYRPRTEAELLRRLAQKGYEAELAREAVDRVRDLGYVDDVDFARFWVRNREQFKPMGARRIRHELFQKGVDRETVQTVIEEELPAEEDEAALRVARKKLRLLVETDYPTFQRRLGGLLARQGFGFDTSARVVRLLWEESRGEGPDPDEDGG